MHEVKISEEGFEICVDCGTAKMALDCCEQTFETSQRRISEIIYSREDRFYRLMCNLRGWQSIKFNEMKKIDSKFNGKTVAELRQILSCSELKHLLGKIATVWRQLGFPLEPPSLLDFKQAMHEFGLIGNTKKSFILLLPYILCKIGREDLCRFCKPPTKLLQRKYMLSVNEAHWHEN